MRRRVEEAGACQPFGKVSRVAEPFLSCRVAFGDGGDEVQRDMASYEFESHVTTLTGDEAEFKGRAVITGLAGDAGLTAEGVTWRMNQRPIAAADGLQAR